MNNEIKDVSVTLPCGKDEFSDFIRSLLGKPQSITNRFRGAFDLNKHDLEQFHYLLLDRLAQQNKVQLIMFTVRIVYDDGSTVQLNDFEAFQTYNEIRPLISTGIHMSWEFLVKFEDRSTPEKQQVEISFIAGEKHHFLDREDSTITIQSSGESEGLISYRINHTARTWGSDIDSLISSHIKTILPDVGGWRRFLTSHTGWIGFGSFFLLFLSSVITLVRISDSFWTASRDALSGAVGAQVDISSKINLIAQHISSGAPERFMAKSIAFIVVSLIISILLAVWATATCDSRKPAFLCLTRKSEESKSKAIRKSERKFLWFCFSIVASIVTGIIGNYIFAVYIQGWKP